MKILSVDKKGYPSEISPTGCVEITIVLVEGNIGDYAAYAGQGSTLFVAEQGDKLSFQEAQQHFSPLEKKKYRER
jgi:hypothetical protein